MPSLISTKKIEQEIFKILNNEGNWNQPNHLLNPLLNKGNKYAVYEWEFEDDKTNITVELVSKILEILFIHLRNKEVIAGTRKGTI